MSLLLLIPGLICLFLVLRGSIETAFLSVYLPCLLSLPDNFRVRIPHLPPTSVAEFTLIPLGIVGLLRLLRGGRFALMDLLVLLFTTSIGLSEILHSPQVNDGIFAAMNAFIAIFLAYVAGRTLIEPDLRLVTVERFVLFVLSNGFAGFYEWRFGQSPYGILGQRVLGIHDIPENVQQRNGRGRMGSVFCGGEPGGIAFAMTYCLNSWLVYLRRVKASVHLGPWMTKLERYHAPGVLLLLYLLMAQSRGPEIALAAAYFILQIPRFKSTKAMTIVVAIVLFSGYQAASAYFKSYTSVGQTSNMTEQQSSAIYRARMNLIYPPIAEVGGWTGWGVLEIPQVEGMKSLDNHYLLVHLAWGRFGYYCFLMIVFENIRVLLVRSWQVESVEDRAFVFSMLAAMSVLWITLLTVFLAGQLPQICFLLIGWMQSTGQSKVRGYSFQRVLS